MATVISAIHQHNNPNIMQMSPMYICIFIYIQQQKFILNENCMICNPVLVKERQISKKSNDIF